MKFLLFLLAFLKLKSSLVLCDTSEKTESSYKKLREHLRNSEIHDPKARPVVNTSYTTVVNHNLVVNFIVSLNDTTHVLILSGWVCMFWNDQYLGWKPDDFGGIKMMRLSPNDLWRPDIVHYNPTWPPYGQVQTNALVLNYGVVIHCPPQNVYANCPMDMTNFPYDQHNCTIPYGSWTYDADKIDIHGHISIEREYSSNNGQWDFTDSGLNKYVEDFGEGGRYPVLSYYLIIARRSGLYYYTIILPTVVAAVLTLLLFWLPVFSYKKISLGCFNMFFLMYQINNTASIVNTSLKVPKILKIQSMTMLVETLALLCTVAVLNLANSAMPFQPPEVLMKILSFTRIPCLLCTEPIQNAKESEPPMEDASTDSDETIKKRSWQIVGQAIDRILFLVFLVSLIAILVM